MVTRFGNLKIINKIKILSCYIIREAGTVISRSS